jgi:hypothetical protein
LISSQLNKQNTINLSLNLLAKIKFKILHKHTHKDLNYYMDWSPTLNKAIFSWKKSTKFTPTEHPQHPNPPKSHLTSTKDQQINSQAE